jgi:Protein of unknown function (DUF3442).
MYKKKSILYGEKSTYDGFVVRIFAAFLFFWAYQLYAEATSYPYQVIASHIEPKGIGYKEGYTSLGLFFAWPKKNSDWTLFWDGRSHVFNQGKIAANSGLGVRYRWRSRLYGLNSYYDFRQSHASYNQVSLGLESLGKRWDFRVNGYLPIGRTEKTYNTAFIGIQRHFLLFSHKREFALSCVQGEAAIHVDKIRTPCSFSIGPYWMNGQGKSSWGGEARFTLDFFSYLRLEGNASYDNLFKWIGQGRLGFVFPFGLKKKQETKAFSSKNRLAFENLGVQRTCRREIIPLDRKFFETPAINPKTGEPYFF